MIWEYKYLSKGDKESEKAAHFKYASKAKHGIVELGVLFGETSRIFMIANPFVPIYGIDPLIPDSKNNKLIGNPQPLINLSKGTNFIFIQEYSHKIVTAWDKRFDYLFIDANHEYDKVKRDFNEWYTKIEYNGVIAVHDSAANRAGPYHWPEPSKLADEIIKNGKAEYVETIYSITFFRKKTCLL